MIVKDSLNFDRLYHDHIHSIYQLALRLLRNGEMAMDATQEIFTKALRARADFQGRSKPSTWLFRIAYNECLGRLNGSRLLQGLEGFDAADSIRARPESIVEERETSIEVRKAIFLLDEDDRRLLCLQMEDDLDYEDLAEILGCSEEAVRMRVSRARRRLKDILKPLLGEKNGG